MNTEKVSGESPDDEQARIGPSKRERGQCREDEVGRQGGLGKGAAERNASIAASSRSLMPDSLMTCDKPMPWDET